jgi:hypothetical protein
VDYLITASWRSLDPIFRAIVATAALVVIVLAVRWESWGRIWEGSRNIRLGSEGPGMLLNSIGPNAIHGHEAGQVRSLRVHWTIAFILDMNYRGELGWVVRSGQRT